MHIPGLADLQAFGQGCLGKVETVIVVSDLKKPYDSSPVFSLLDGRNDRLLPVGYKNGFYLAQKTEGHQ